MKKILIIWFILLTGILLTGCWKKVDDHVVQQIDAITKLQQDVDSISQRLLAWEITPQQAEELTDKLQPTYAELTEEQINESIQWIKKIISDKIALTEINGLPDRTKSLWLVEPIGMELNKTVSRQTSVNDQWYDSITLVYKWSYDVAMAQAKLIADKANISVSKEFQQAQELMSKQWNSMKWIVYTNHGLLDTKIDYLIAITVDEDGTLTMEVTNYQQMKNRD